MDSTKSLIDRTLMAALLRRLGECQRCVRLMSNTDFVTIQSFDHRLQADMLLMVLHQRDIPARLADELAYPAAFRCPRTKAFVPIADGLMMGSWHGMTPENHANQTILSSGKSSNITRSGPRSMA